MAEELSRSPRWGFTVKLIITLGLVIIFVALLFQFQNVLGPLLLSFVLSFMLHPLVSRMQRLTRLSWRANVNIVFLLVIIFLVGMFTVLGFAVAEQAQNLVTFVDGLLDNLPQIVEDLTTQVFVFGPFQLDFRQYDFNVLLGDLAGALQPIVTRAGSLVSSLASGTISLVGWGAFVLLVSYFVTSDATKLPTDQWAQIEIPGYGVDIRRLARRLGRIWSGFLRGQFFIFVFIITVYSLLLTVLGVRNALALGIMAGFSRFIPYVGQYFTWLLIALVTVFMPENMFGMEPVYYMLLVIALAVVLDQTFDTFIVPRLYGVALGVHPAAVMIGAILGGSLLGFVGLVVAAPATATLLLFMRYIFRKLLDLDPWPRGDEDELQVFQIPGLTQIRQVSTALVSKFKSWRQKSHGQK